MVTQDDSTREPNEILPPPDYDVLLFLLMVEVMGIAIVAERLIQREAP